MKLFGDTPQCHSIKDAITIELNYDSSIKLGDIIKLNPKKIKKLGCSHSL